MASENYLFFSNGSFALTCVADIAKEMGIPKNVHFDSYMNDIDYAHVWSARLGTGIFGFCGCPSGNKGPKKKNEVMLARGNQGLRTLVSLGFLPCPSCKPYELEDFFPRVFDVVFEKYGLSDLDSFLNRDSLPFDARRVDFETILPFTKQAPDRLYVPQGLENSDLVLLKERFERMDVSLPIVGYYDSQAPGNFCAYVF